MSLDLHPLCMLFPRLSGAEFDALRTLIDRGQVERENGQVPRYRRVG